MDGLAIQRNNILFLKRVLTLLEEGFLTFLWNRNPKHMLVAISSLEGIARSLYFWFQRSWSAKMSHHFQWKTKDVASLHQRLWFPFGEVRNRIWMGKRLEIILYTFSFLRSGCQFLLLLIYFMSNFFWGRRDLNPHDFKNQRILSPLRLPIPPRPLLSNESYGNK